MALLLGPSVDSAGRGDDRLWLLGSGAKLANTFAYHVIMLQKSSNGGDAKKSLHQNWLSVHQGFKVLHSIPDFHVLPGPSWTHVTIVGIWPPSWQGLLPTSQIVLLGSLQSFCLR